MQSLRTIRYFVRVLVGLFLVAQFAGVVASPLTSARAAAPTVIASQVHDHHADHHGDRGTLRHRKCAEEDLELKRSLVSVLLPSSMGSSAALIWTVSTGRQDLCRDLSRSVSAFADPPRIAQRFGDQCPNIDGLYLHSGSERCCASLSAS